MKTMLTYLFSFSAVLFLVSCANGKKIQEKPPVALQPVYYTTWQGDAKGAGSGYTLFIPLSVAVVSEVEFDSVYFRGKKAVLETKPNFPDVYLAHFRERPAKPRDFVMSSDPREEYGNQPPVIPQEIPFELEEDEAVVLYKKNGKKSYFRIKGIQKRDSTNLEIKRH
ncbi:MAG TPA: hypothetical protein VFM59_03125 [Salinimicrobium sp.]|nr:hypothetical protein [Salinimicrobium sp.]